jgi:sulfite reductase (ferredoxin)
LLYDIDPGHKAAIQSILSRCGIQAETAIDPLVRNSMACPALPTCGLAITESERILPSVLELIRALLTKVGLPDEQMIIRMTGCPNGCARPYLAELAFVGSHTESYQVWLGAASNQTRLAQVYLDRMHINDLEAKLEPIFVYFKQDRLAGESFGDFCNRVGLAAIHQFADSYQPLGMVVPEVLQSPVAELPIKVGESRHRVGMSKDLYARVKAIADQQGRPVSHLVSEAMETYLKQVNQ